MIDNSELALHNISSEIEKLNLEKKVDVDFKICDISRPEDVNSLFSKIDLIQFIMQQHISMFQFWKIISSKQFEIIF